MIDPRIEYENRLQTLVEQLDAEMWRLRQQAHEADDAEDAAKAAVERRIEALAARQRLARETLHRLQAADDNAWDELKPDVENTWRRLTDSVSNGYGVF